MKPENEAPKPSTRGSRLRGVLRLVLVIALVLVLVTFVFPFIFEPRIDVPTKLEFASPSAVQFQISNQNLTPLTDIDYTCEISKLVLADGSAPRDATVVIRGNVRKISGRRAILGRCQTAYVLAATVKTVEYTLTMKYKTYPWPRLRTSTYQIAANVNGKGEVTGWKLE